MVLNPIAPNNQLGQAGHRQSFQHQARRQRITASKITYTPSAIGTCEPGDRC